MGELDGLGAVWLNGLDSAVGENALFSARWLDVLNRSVWETDLFISVWVVLFDLLVREFENLQAIGERSLGSLGLGEEVNHLLIWVSLLDVAVSEVHDCVTVREGFAPHLVAENYFLFVVEEHTLNLSIVSFNFALHSLVVGVLIVVLPGVLDIVETPVSDWLSEC